MVLEVGFGILFLNVFFAGAELFDARVLGR